MPALLPLGWGDGRGHQAWSAAPLPLRSPGLPPPKAEGPTDAPPQGLCLPHVTRTHSRRGWGGERTRGSPLVRCHPWGGSSGRSRQKLGFLVQVEQGRLLSSFWRFSAAPSRTFSAPVPALPPPRPPCPRSGLRDLLVFWGQLTDQDTFRASGAGGDTFLPHRDGIC